MSSIICKNKQGISLVESIISILLVSIGLIAFLSLQPTSWKTSSRTDYLGRGIMVLNNEIMTQELWIMNPCNTVTTGTVNKVLYSSDQQTAQPGDVSFTVQTVTSAIAGKANTWEVTVIVSWPPLNTKGITDNLIVTRQESFRFGCI
jgi:Tfp pilus assembly protein PilV